MRGTTSDGEGRARVVGERPNVRDAKVGVFVVRGVGCGSVVIDRVGGEVDLPIDTCSGFIRICSGR